MRPAERLHHRDRLPQRPAAPRGRPPRRCSSRWPRSASRSRSRLPDRRLLHATSPACRTTCTHNNLGIAVGGWGADWPDGYGFLSQLVDGKADRARPGTPTSSSTTRRQRLFDQARAPPTAPAERDLGPDRQAGHGGRGDPADRVRQGLLYRPPTLTNVYFNDGLRHVRLRRHRRDVADSANPESTAERRRQVRARWPAADYPGPRTGAGDMVSFIIRRLIAAVVPADHRQHGHFRHLLPDPAAGRADHLRAGRAIRGAQPTRDAILRSSGSSAWTIRSTCSTGGSSRASWSARTTGPARTASTARRRASAIRSRTSSRSGRRWSATSR